MRLRSRLPGVDVPVKVVGTEVDDRGLLVGEEMPDDHQDRAADDDGPIFPSPSGGSPPPVTATEVSVLPATTASPRTRAR